MMHDPSNAEANRDATLTALAMLRLTGGTPIEELPQEVLEALLSPSSGEDDLVSRYVYVERVNGALLSIARSLLDVTADRGEAYLAAMTDSALLRRLDGGGVV